MQEPAGGAGAPLIEHKMLTEKQFAVIARSQNELRDAENAMVEANKRLTNARQEADAIYALVCEAHGIPDGTQVQLDVQKRELLFEAPPAPPAPAAPSNP